MTRPRVPLLDLLVLRHPGRSARELSAAVMRGEVTVDGRPVLKPGVRVPEDAAVKVRAGRPYVSRGGEKLAAALDAWGIDCGGRVFLDAGCSTGGFTDCLLSRGAARVHAVDVGVNIVAWSLRTDPRVAVREATNVMSLSPGSLEPAPEAAVADLSFRSLRGAAAHILRLAASGWGIFLVKPQFEWEDPPPEFRGVVRDVRDQRAIAEGLLADLAREGVRAARAAESPIRGRRGNREFLLLLHREHAVPPVAPRLHEDLEVLWSQ
jgi:23S rRNA (cytidine1920-2'-O)/16S rRNA (cytidine1409-2'-O)-methyltransferase